MIRIASIAFALLLSIFASAQSLYQVGDHDMDHVVASDRQGNTLYVVSVDADRDYRVMSWDGLNWTDLGEVSSLPLHGSNPDGEFRLTDIKVMGQEIFVCGNYIINTSGTDANVVAHFDGNSWSDISNNIIRNSEELTELVVLNSAVHVIGKFRVGTPYNVLKWNGTSWDDQGDLLLKDHNSDFISDVDVIDGKLQAAGKFTKAGLTSTYTTAVLTNGTWSPAEVPGYVTEAYLMTEWNGDMVLAGKANISGDHVKVLRQSGWENISSGLNAYDVQEKWDILALADKLYLTGLFISNSSGDTSNVLIFSNGSWIDPNWKRMGNHIDLAHNNRDVFVLGDINSKGVSGIALLGSGEYLISGSVFLDANSNCSRESDEKGIAFSYVELNPGGHIFRTDRYGRFEIPALKGDYTISAGMNPLYGSQCDNTYEVTLDEKGRYEVGHIGLTPKENVVDLDVGIISTNGWTISKISENSIKLKVHNGGNATLANGKLKLQIPSWMQISWNIEPQEEDGYLVWNITNLEADSIFCVEATISVPNVDYGTTGRFIWDIELEKSDADVDPRNDTGNIEFEVAEHEGPIFKQISEKEVTTNAKSVSYHIGVQNVSGRTVNDFWLRDTLDEDLYITFVREYASFPSELKQTYIPLDNGNYQYIFTWIASESFQLMDSGVNMEASKAFVQVELSLADGFLQKDDQICNQAEVFFDNLEPLYTNLVCRSVSNVSVEPVGQRDLPVIAYPNPNHGELSLYNSSNGEIVLDLADIHGRTVAQPIALKPGERRTVQLDLGAGVYFLKATSYGSMKLFVE